MTPPQLFVDTNIVLDLLTKRGEFYGPAAQLFSLADRGKVTLSVSALSFANINYILTREKDRHQARRILRDLNSLVTILAPDAKVVALALNDEAFTDFEDGLQHYTALGHASDAIITRNLKDFRKAALPVLTADQFLRQ